MKKRRSNPIPLLSVMILCVALIGWFNNRSAPQDKAAPQQPQPAQNVANPSALGTSRQAPSKDTIAGDVHIGSDSTTGKGPLMPVGSPQIGHPPTPGGGGPAGGPPGMPPGAMPPGMKSSQKMRPAKPYKPKPSDSSISTQWYTDETNKSVGN